ncbi:SDR family NAD(P)-dependent oxidoreductase [Microbacterium sp. A196]|uniref:SDR family NAD(P)-dependent oxidoreductase n=1 Tax=Microbacterium sp. A196 TaxID=3457320 RepID=UPI003FD0E66E
MSDLHGKVAIVTGAGSGMGRATVLALLHAGASVMAADASEAALASLPQHPRLISQQCDVRVSADVGGVVARTTAEFGGLDSVFNAAGVCRTEALIADSTAWEDSFDVNVHGVLTVARAAIPAMKARGGGVIVNWGSNSAFRASPGLSAYCISKAAVVMLTKCLAVEHASDGIRANVISPGFVATPMIQAQAETYASEQDWYDSVSSVQPLGIGAPEAVADVAVFLASDAARHMTGSVVTVDGGGLAMAPVARPPSSSSHNAPR